MTVFLKFCAFHLICFVVSARKVDTTARKDLPYEVIKVNIPRSVWRQALNPTPILKSQATVVLPVYVSDENEVNDEYLNDEEDVVDTTTESDVVVQDVSVAPSVVADDTVASEAPVSEAPISEAPISEAPVNDPPAEQPVAGQVFRFPCSCRNGQCGCCTGSILDRYGMKTCGNISFVPEDFVFDVRLSVNNATVVRQRVSASDPPPICFNPRRAPFVRVCAEISNIRIRNRNAYACLDINADIGGFPVYSASFRCFGLGTSGVQSGLKPKPPSSGPAPISLYGNNDDDDRDSFLENAAGAIFGGGEGGGLFGGDGLFGGGGGGGGDDDGGPLDGIGDAIGDFLDGRSIKV